jgi:hypothetical protein
LSIPVPLGVRIYDHWNNVDQWVTKWVDDLQYRSVIPGGFASASFRLHVPQHMYPVAAAWMPRAPRIPLVMLFNRVQVVDLRSGEITWEGRIDSAARVTDDGFAWDIGCAGAMVAATDVTRPVFYADSSADSWVSHDARPSVKDSLSLGQTESPPSLNADLRPGSQWTDAGSIYAYYHVLCLGTEQYLGRFTLTYSSTAASVTGGTGMKNRANVYTPSTDTWQEGVDSTSFGAADITKSNAVAGSSSFTSTVAQAIGLDIIGPATLVNIPSSSSGSVRWQDPIVIPQRMDRNGSLLNSAASYTTDYVTVSQVVEDVLGRFLNSGWSDAGGNIPANGSVGTAGAYIDSSDSTGITDLKFLDGATAADILNQLMSVQTNAYWAIWESQNTATNGTDSQRYRFEWATWPNGWGYQASSADGFDEQPDGSKMYDFVFYQYTPRWNESFYIMPVQVQEWWAFTDPSPAPILRDRVTRAATVKKDGLVDGGTAGNLAEDWIGENGQEVNAGSLIVKRPIQFYDAGSNSGSGAGRMLDPWAIRPGKLIRITDIPAQADATSINHGTTAPPATHAGAVFRVVSTDYDAADNSCRLGLDQVDIWSLAGQILPGAPTNARTVLG